MEKNWVQAEKDPVENSDQIFFFWFVHLKKKFKKNFVFHCTGNKCLGNGVEK